MIIRGIKEGRRRDKLRAARKCTACGETVGSLSFQERDDGAIHSVCAEKDSLLDAAIVVLRELYLGTHDSGTNGMKMLLRAAREANSEDAPSIETLVQEARP